MNTPLSLSALIVLTSWEHMQPCQVRQAHSQQ